MLPNNTKNGQYHNPQTSSPTQNTQIMSPTYPSSYQPQQYMINNSNNMMNPIQQYEIPPTQLHPQNQPIQVYQKPGTLPQNPNNMMNPNQQQSPNQMFTEENTKLTIQSPQLQVNKPTQLINTTQDITRFKVASQVLTYILGFCSLNALFGIIEYSSILQMFSDLKLTLPSIFSALIAFSFISYSLIFSAFIILLIARLKMHFVLILTSLVLIMVSFVFYLIGLFIEFGYYSNFDMPSPFGTFVITAIIQAILYGICYYSMLIILSVRVAIFLASDMNKPNFIAYYAIKIKNKFKNVQNP